MADADETPKPWLMWLVAPFVFPGVFIFIVLPLGILAGLSIPVTTVMAAVQRSQERRFLEQMRERGRLARWRELEPTLLSGEGTLIVEQALKAPARVWWTDEDVAGICPAPVPTEEKLRYYLLGNPDPFVDWCFQRYLHPQTGRAIVTDLPDPNPPPSLQSDYLSGRFPQVRVIMTARTILKG